MPHPGKGKVIRSAGQRETEKKESERERERESEPLGKPKASIRHAAWRADIP